MAIPNRQIGWSQESNLLWQISSQMERLTGVVSANAPTPPSYKVYTALLSQSGTNAPTAIVLENTTNIEINFLRTEAGRYTINYSLTGAGPEQVFLIMPQMKLNGFEEQVIYYMVVVTAGLIYLDTYREISGYDDELLTNVPIEIRFYN